MSLSILSHTFPMTVSLTLVEARGDRHHYITPDGRDILSKPSTNPAAMNGRTYWHCTYSPDIAPFLAGRIA